MSSLRRTWDPGDREDVRRFHAGLWPRVRERLREEVGGRSRLTEHPRLRDALSEMVRDGYGAEDVAVTFGVSRERARQWLGDVLTEEESEARGATAFRVWDPDRERFVPCGLEEVRPPERPRELVDEEGERLAELRSGDVETVRRLVSVLRHRPPATIEVEEERGDSYQNIARRWRKPGEGYAAGWDRLYREAGTQRPDARTIEFRHIGT